jgi:hypothetical protein
MRVSLCYERISSAERNRREREGERESEECEGVRGGERERDMQTARGRSTQCTNSSDPITSTSELLLRQISVTAHAHQS